MKYIKLFENYFEDEEFIRLAPLFLKSQKELSDLFWSELERSTIDIQIIRDLLETQLIDLLELKDYKENSPILSPEIYRQDLLELFELFVEYGENIEAISPYDGSSPKLS